MASRVRQERGELLMRVATSLTSYYMRLLRRKMREFCKGDQSKTTLLVVSVVMLKYTGEEKAIISCIITSPKSGWLGRHSPEGFGFAGSTSTSTTFLDIMGML